MKLLSLLVMAAFVMGPRLKVLDLHMAASVALAGIGFILLSQRRVMPAALKWSLSTVIPLLAYSLLMAMSVGAADVTLPAIAMKLLIYLLAAYAVVDLYCWSYPDQLEEAVLRHVFWICVADAAFVVLVILSASFREMAAALLWLDAKEHWVESGYRAFDVSLGGGASAAIVLSTVMICGLAKARAIGRSFTVMVGIFLLMAGAFFTGRTGLVVMAIGITMLVLRSLNQHDGTSSTSVIFGLGVLLAIAAGYVFLSQSVPAVQIRETVLPWALEGLVGGNEGGGNRSLNKIVDTMYIAPDSDWIALFGSSNAGRSENLPYIPTDVGYIRVIFAIGIVGLLCLLLAYGQILASSWRLSQRSVLAFPVLFFLVIHAVANFKELFIAHRAGGAILAVWFVAMVTAHGESSSQGHQRPALTDPDTGIRPRSQ